MEESQSPWDSAREEERRRLLPVPKTDASNVRAIKAGRMGRWRVSHHFHTKFRPPVFVPTEVSTSASKSQTSFTAGHGSFTSSSRCSQSSVTKSFGGGRSPPNSSSCLASTAVTSPKSTCGTVGFKSRSANGQEDQLQKKRGTKGTSKTDSMEET